MIAERVDRGITIWSKRLGLILLGWFASSAYHGTMDLTQKAHTLQHVQAVELPAAKAAAHCEDARADRATQVAKDAIKGALVDTAPIPSPSAIPTDNCPHPGSK